MKNFSLLSLLAVCFCLNTNAQTTLAKTKNCGHAQRENYLRSIDPEYDAKRAAVEATYQQDLQNSNKVSAQYTIPVVVHVVYNTSVQNVSDAQVLANLSQLNLDFSRQNADVGNTPAVWQPIAADMQIQFCLVTKDPNGNPTTGIVHKQTSTTSFGLTGSANPAYNLSGGDDMWDPDKYLNIYVCPLTGGLYGYATQPPNGANYNCVLDFKTIGSFLSPGANGFPYGCGRTMSHEIGHSMNLDHIWGDDSGACTGTDNVSDTPNQGDANGGHLSGVQTDACATGSPGMMYQNYMDYTDDDCLNLFTAGQKTRSQSAVATYLMSLVNAAPTKCTSSTGLEEDWLANSISFFPNPSTGEVFINAASPDLSCMNVRVYNAIGETLFLREISLPSLKETKFDLSKYPNGLYFFELNTSRGSITKKLVLNR